MFTAKRTGFTIVELLIVIVVIGILAAITIVAYNGIQDKTKHSAAKSAASQVSKKILLYAVENNDAYPADLQDISIAASGQTSYQYVSDNTVSPRTYCVTATFQNVSYYQSTTQLTPVPGACSGHGLNGLPPNLAANPSFETETTPVTTRTNLAINPSFEVNTTGWSTVNGGTGAAVATSTTQAHTGSRSLVYTYGDSVTQDSGPVGNIAATAGVTYSVSAWVYAPAAISGGLRIMVFGAAIGNTERGTISATTGSWVRLTYTTTASATGTLTYAIAKGAGTADTGKLLYIDSVLVEASSAAGYYFSGASSSIGDFSYAWSGTTHSSASTERAPGLASYSQNGSGLVRMRSAERSTSGNYSGRVLVTTAATNPGLFQVLTLQPGTYTFISKVWIESGVSANVALTAQGTGVAVGSTTGFQGSTTLQGQWVELRRLITVSVVTNLNFYVYIPLTYTVVGASFWVDDFAVVAGDCTSSACY